MLFTDEGALVKAAKELGIVFKARTPTSIIIEVVMNIIHKIMHDASSTKSSEYHEWESLWFMYMYVCIYTYMYMDLSHRMDQRKYMNYLTCSNLTGIYV